jgi:hypothetical protein
VNPVALNPVFLLSGIASLLGVLSTRLERVADRVDCALLTIGALLAFLIEVLLASRGIRDLAASAGEPEDAPDPPHDEGGQGAAEPSGGEAARDHNAFWAMARLRDRDRPSIIRECVRILVTQSTHHAIRGRN